jgi:hypothetical protein
MKAQLLLTYGGDWRSMAAPRSRVGATGAAHLGLRLGAICLTLTCYLCRARTANKEHWVRNDSKAGAIFEVRSVSKYFGAIHALTEVDLTLEPGEVPGLMGDNAHRRSIGPAMNIAFSAKMQFLVDIT